MTIWLWLPLALLGAPILMLYGVAPLIARQRSAQSTEPALVELPESQQPPPEAVALLEQTRETLLDAGFVAEPAHRLEPAPAQQTVELYPFRQPHSGVLAYVAVLVFAQKNLRLVQTPTIIVRPLADGQVLTLTNAEQPDGLPAPPQWCVYHAPAGAPVADMLAWHQAIAGSEFASLRARPQDGDAITLHRQSMQQQLAHARRVGALTPTRGGQLRLSLRWSYVLTWQQLWPLKQRWRRQVDARFARACARAGLPALPGEVCPPPQQLDDTTVFSLRGDTRIRPFSVSTPFSPGKSMLLTRGLKTISAPVQGQQLRVGAQGLVLPGALELSYDRLTFLMQVGQGQRETLLLRGSGADEAPIRADLPARFFRNREDFLVCVTAIRQRIAAQPDGGQRARAHAAAERQTQVVMQRRPWLTRGWVLLMVVFWLAQGRVAGGDPLGTLLLGAFVPDLVRAGDWHRVLNANLLHGQALPFVLMALATWLVGGICERVLGSLRFAFAFLSGAAAGFASLLIHAGGWQAYGGSSALAALAGILIVTMLHGGHITSLGEMQRAHKLEVVLAALVLLLVGLEWFLLGSLLHIAAGVVGAMAAWLVIVLPPGADALLERRAGMAQIPGTLALLLALGCVVAGLWQSGRPSTALEGALLRLEASGSADWALVEYCEPARQRLAFKGPSAARVDALCRSAGERVEAWSAD